MNMNLKTLRRYCFWHPFTLKGMMPIVITYPLRKKDLHLEYKISSPLFIQNTQMQVLSAEIQSTGKEFDMNH